MNVELNRPAQERLGAPALTSAATRKRLPFSCGTDDSSGLTQNARTVNAV